MSGFVKGVVIGLASFAAGFAVLSVVLPPPEGPMTDPVQGMGQGAQVMEADEPVTLPAPAPAAEPANTGRVEAVTEAPASPTVTLPEPGSPVVEAPEVAEAPPVAPVAEMAAGNAGIDAAADDAAGEAATPVAPLLPVVEAPEVDEAPPVAPVAEMAAGNAGIDAAAEDAPGEAATPVAPLLPVVEAPEVAQAPLPVAPVVEVAVRPLDAVPARDDLHPAPFIEPSPDTARSAQPAEQMPPETPIVAQPSSPPAVAASSPANTLLAEASTDTTITASPPQAPVSDAVPVMRSSEPTPIAPLARPPVPVPAQSATIPGNEPLLITPTAPPAVVAMPGTGEAAVVRRGGEAVATLPQAVDGVTIRRPGIDPAPAPAGASPEFTDLAPLPALRRHAAAFTPSEGTRPLGLVLIDAAEAQAALVALPFAITIALDPGDPSAPARAAAYRAAGHEVALLAQGFPRLADASDVLVTLSAWQALFPEALALMDVPVNGLGAQRILARDVAAMLAPAGMGAIALRDGVDALMAAARAEDVPALALYRQIEAESDIALRRMIDRAAFEAARRDGVVIAASAADSAVMAALTDQGISGRDGVVFAPVSALLAPP